LQPDRENGWTSASAAAIGIAVYCGFFNAKMVSVWLSNENRSGINGRLPAFYRWSSPQHGLVAEMEM
jgi:hypothetical protein